MKTISLIFISLMISSAIDGSSYPVPLKAKPVYNSIGDILRTIDPNILPHSPYEPESTQGVNASVDFIEILNQKAADIRNYISVKYSEDLSNLSNKEIIALALVIVPFELREAFGQRVSNQDIFNCMLQAVGVIGGIYGLINNFISLWNSGATVSTLIGTIKNIFQISSGWFAVGYGVYKFGDCVGWW